MRPLSTLLLVLSLNTSPSSFQESPTGPPVAQVTTPVPSSCEDQQWYFDGSLNACARDTNNQGGTLYASFDDCCSAESFDDGCIIFDGCNSRQPNKAISTAAPISVSFSVVNLFPRITLFYWRCFVQAEPTFEPTLKPTILEIITVSIACI